MPLPKPFEGESQNDFMGRCVVDPNIVNDFGTIDQRVAVCSNLFNPPKEEKAQDNWPDEFENELSKAERTSIKDFTEFYKAEYNDAIDLYLKIKSMTTATAQQFFQDSKYVGMYEGMYSKIGLQFANWYSRNVEKYMPKADPGNMESIWANAFAFMGNQVAGQRVTMVSSTAQATLTNTLRQFMSDPIFMSAGEKVQAKMLRQKFDYLADYQARRIVRTEATNAANYATEQAALNLFPGADMTKTWKSGYDARVRPAHQAANNQVVPFNSKFSVGGESLQRPGDPNGSASNVINCRCSMIVLPKAGANTIGPRITNIGFGMAQAEIVDAISPALLAPEVIATVVAETAIVEAQVEAKTINEAKDKAVAILESNGLKIGDVEISDKMSVELLNKYNNQLEILANQYKLDSSYNTRFKIDLKYKSSSRAYGWVDTLNGNVEVINFGVTTDPLKNRTRDKLNTEFSRRFKSVVDEKNIDIATITHEFAHVIATRDAELYTISNENFYYDLRELKSKYVSEKRKFVKNLDFKGYNDIHLGEYANTNIDEFMAEGFTEYKLSSNPSKYAIEIGKLIEKYFKK